MAAEQRRELVQILSLLPDGWKLARLGPASMGWFAELHFKNMMFGVLSHEMELDVSRIVSSKGRHKERPIECPDEWKIHLTPRQAALLLVEDAELWLRETEPTYKGQKPKLRRN